MPFGTTEGFKGGIRAACSACALLVVLCTNVQAQDRFGGSLAITTDYVYRGVSLSRGRLAYQAGVHVRLPARWQVGVWGSTIETSDRRGNPIQATASVARSWALTDNWSALTSYTHYEYFGLRTSFAPDYDEFEASLNFRSQLALTLSWAPNVVRYGSHQYAYLYQSSAVRRSAWATEAAWLQPVWRDWSATTGIGYHDLSELYGGAYLYWHVGLTGVYGPFELDLLHINSDGDARRFYGRQSTGQRWSALLRWRF